MEIPTLDQLLAEQRRRYGRRFSRRIALSGSLMLLFASASAVLLVMLCLPVLRVDGASMEPLLKEGDLAFTVRTSEAEPGDVVSFLSADGLMAGRVIAGSGDVLDIRENGDVYVNGALLSEPYVAGRGPAAYDADTFPLRIPGDSVFVLGDNRAAGTAPRAAGCIGKERITGRVVFRFRAPCRFARVG